MTLLEKWKTMEHVNDDHTIVIGAFNTVTKGFQQGLEDWKEEDE